jgi:DHA1 family tetracycline resistance protein-like MFS transporter
MAVLIDMIAVGVIMPVLPALVGSFSDSKADNVFWYGVVACSFGAANFIGAPFRGALSDRFGRRPILLTSFSVMAGCLLLTGLAAANAAFGLFVMPETLAAEDRRPLAWQRLTPFSSIHDLASLRGVGPLAAVLTLAYLAQFILPATWALMMKFKFGWGPRETGWSLFAYGFMLVVSQGFLIRFVLARRSPLWLTLAGLLSASLAFMAYGLAWAP